MKTHHGAKETEIEEVVGDFLKRTPFLPGGKKWKVNSFYFCLCFYFLFSIFSLYIMWIFIKIQKYVAFFDQFLFGH